MFVAYRSVSIFLRAILAVAVLVAPLIGVVGAASGPGGDATAADSAVPDAQRNLTVAVSESVGGDDGGLAGPVSGPMATTDRSGRECVVREGPRDVFPDSIDIRCVDIAGSNETRVNVLMSESWLYTVVVELPPSARPDHAEFAIPTEPYAVSWKAPASEWRQSLRAHTGRDGTKTKTLVYTDPEVKVLSQDELKYWRDEEFQGEFRLEPGVYELELRVQNSMTGDSQFAYTDLEGMERVLGRTSERRERIQIAVGGCDPNFDAGQRLRSLDQQRLQIHAEIGEIRRKWATQRKRFARGTAAITALFGGKVLGFAKSAAKQGAVQAFQGLQGEFGAGPSVFTIADIKTKVTDDAWRLRSNLIRQSKEKLIELREINERYDDTIETIERCHGEQFQMPDDYEPPDADDLEAAKADNGWP
jgi:hypothetical protein